MKQINEIEIQITEHLSVKIDNQSHSRVSAYIDGKRKSYCSYVLITAPIDAPEDNMDDIIDVYGKSEEECKKLSKLLTPQDLLFVHASNLEGWVLNDYNIACLHTNISIPLLKSLAKVDPKAQDKALQIAHERWNEACKEKDEKTKEALFLQWPSQMKILSTTGIIPRSESARIKIDGLFRAMFPDLNELELLDKLDDWNDQDLLTIDDIYSYNSVEYTIDFYKWFKDFGLDLDLTIRMREVYNFEGFTCVCDFLEKRFDLKNLYNFPITIENIFDDPVIYETFEFNGEMVTVIEWKDEIYAFNYDNSGYDMIPVCEINVNSQFFYLDFDNQGYETYSELTSDGDDWNKKQVEIHIEKSNASIGKAMEKVGHSNQKQIEKATYNEDILNLNDICLTDHIEEIDYEYWFIYGDIKDKLSISVCIRNE
jgi:hypothetical protein